MLKLLLLVRTFSYVRGFLMKYGLHSRLCNDFFLQMIINCDVHQRFV